MLTYLTFGNRNSVFYDSLRYSHDMMVFKRNGGKYIGPKLLNMPLKYQEKDWNIHSAFFWSLAIA